jgi:hypothetical protein
MTVQIAIDARPGGPTAKHQPSPDPDFLWNLLAAADFMRLSLTKAAHADVAGPRAGNPEKGWVPNSEFDLSAGGAALNLPLA